MTDQHIKESAAVRSLKHGIEQYAHALRQAIDDARRQTAHAERQAQATLELTRAELQAREQELGQAEAAMRQAGGDSGGLRQRTQIAAQRLTEAKRRHDRARQAAQMSSSAHTELLKALHTVEGTVGEHHSFAASVLSELERRIADVVGLGRDALKAAMVTSSVVAHTVGPGAGISDSLHAVNHNIAGPDHSSTQMVERIEQDQEDYEGEEQPKRAHEQMLRSIENGGQT